MSAPFEPLAASLSAVVTDEGPGPAVALALTVRNEGDETVTLRFRTGQRADFAAYPIAAETDPPERAEADPVWRHGEGRLFTQVVGTETLPPGDAATYEGTWVDPTPGAYAVEGWLTASARGDGARDTDGDETSDASPGVGETDGDGSDGRRPRATATVEVGE